MVRLPGFSGARREVSSLVSSSALSQTSFPIYYSLQILYISSLQKFKFEWNLLFSSDFFYNTKYFQILVIYRKILGTDKTLNIFDFRKGQLRLFNAIFLHEKFYILKFLNLLIFSQNTILGKKILIFMNFPMLERALWLQKRYLYNFLVIWNKEKLYHGLARPLIWIL